MRRNTAIHDAAHFEQHDHVAWAGDGQDALNRLATASFVVGATRHEQMLFIANDANPHRLDALARRDVLLASGELEMISAESVYGDGTTFDPATQVEVFEETLDDVLAAGYNGLRIVADHTSLVRGDDAAFAAWLAWEQLSDTFQARREVIGVCYFDRTQIAPARLDDLASVHPVRSPTLHEPTFHLYADEGRTVVRGYLDASSEQPLLRILSSAPATDSIALDVAEIEYIDHRVLLALNEHARTVVPVRLVGARSIIRQIWGVVDVPERVLEFV